MHHLIEIFHTLTDKEWILSHGGIYFVMFIIFAETGLFVGFFLPGDSLLFVTGLMIANSHSPFGNNFVNLIYWIALISLAGVLGNMAGYWFGKKTGPLLLERKD